MVRLKELESTLLLQVHIISIPYGAIKSFFDKRLFFDLVHFNSLWWDNIETVETVETGRVK